MMELRSLKSRYGLAVLLIGTGVMLGLGPVAHANLLTNPGFEDTNTDSNYGDDWFSFGAAGFHNFFGNPHASFFSDNPGNSGGIFQLGIPAVAGTEYQFDLLDVRIEANADANFSFGLEFYEADDSTQVDTTIVPLSLTPTGDGLSFSMTATAPAGSFVVRPIVQFDNTIGAADSQENVFIFETSLTAVPEPATVLLLGMGGLVLFRKRTK